jgi:hypothetical protein
MCAIALWRDEEGTGMTSITFFPNLVKGAKQDVEMTVSEPRESNKGRKKSNVVILQAVDTSREKGNEEDSLGGRQGSVGSIGSNTSTLSNESASMGMWRVRSASSSSVPRVKGAGNGKKKCVVEFTKTLDRVAFESHFLVTSDTM